jgi:hypothetical protein
VIKILVTFLGGEQPVNVRTLLEQDARSIGVSYSALVRRSGGKPRQSLAERYTEDHELLLDSGAYAANNEPNKRSLDDWLKYAEDYTEFALTNAERATWITEFDFLGLGIDWIYEMRRGAWKDAGEKFLPVWHPEMGLASLDVTAEEYGRIAVIGNVLAQPGQSASSQLVRLARRGVEVHGLALTKPDIAENIPFAQVASSSWLSPQKFGDVQVWDGRALHRYPTKYSKQGRLRHTAWVGEQGFDVEAWSDEEHPEHTQTLVKVAVWSWLRWSEYASERHGPRVVLSRNNSESDADDEAPPSAEIVPLVTTARKVAKPRETVDLPVLSFSRPNEDSDEMLPVINDTSLRVCDNCFLASNCPKFEEGAACAFKIPVRVETKGQKKALFNSLIEMQYQRVAFLRMSEELSGGYPDPNLSAEEDRLVKMMATQAEMEDERDYFSMTVQARGSKGGIISQLMGTQVGAAASRLERPLDEVDTDRVIAGVLEPPK